MSAPAALRERLVSPCPPHAGDDFERVLAVAEQCGDCLVTDPVTGEWVSGCPSNAEHP